MNIYIFGIIATLGLTSSMACLIVAGITGKSIFGEGACVILGLVFLLVAVWFISLLLKWMHEEK